MKAKSNYFVMVMSSIVCLLPVILSLGIYNELPDKIAIHWDSAGNPDNYASKAFVAVGLPFLFVAINICVNFYLRNAPKRANASAVVIVMASWLCPLVSMILVPITLFISMGASIPISFIGPVLAGVALIVFGNYLPKSRQNYVVGIKLP